MVLSREKFCSDAHMPLQSPVSTQTSCSLLLSEHMCTFLMVDGPHAPTEAVLSDCMSGLSHANENKAAGTGALRESM